MTKPYPVFETPSDVIEKLLREGREEWGHPSTWEAPGEALRPLESYQDQPSPTCPSGLHPSGKTKNGECRECVNLRARRARNARNGKPICWTGKHPEPDPGTICPCGEPAPEETFADWAIVERVITGYGAPRDLTSAEELSCITTVARTYGIGAYEASSWLYENTCLWLDDKRVEYLTGVWLDRTGATPKSVSDLMHDDYSGDQTAEPALTNAAA